MGPKESPTDTLLEAIQYYCISKENEMKLPLDDDIVAKLISVRVSFTTSVTGTQAAPQWRKERSVCERASAVYGLQKAAQRRIETAGALMNADAL